MPGPEEAEGHAQDARGIEHAREGTEDVRLGDDADQLALVEHGQATDLVLEHRARGRLDVVIRVDRDELRRHDARDREALALMPGVRLGLRDGAGQDSQQVTQAHDAGETSDAHDGSAAQRVRAKLAEGGEAGEAFVDGSDSATHEAADQHRRSHRQRLRRRSIRTRWPRRPVHSRAFGRGGQTRGR